MHKVKQRLQNHFTDGLVTIIGCGLSSAEGLPDMMELGAHLRTEVARRIQPSEQAAWSGIVSLLDAGRNIEEAMLTAPPNPTLETHIVTATAEYILQRELETIEQVVSGRKVLRLTKLLAHILKPQEGIPIITTNYDRLVEVAAEAAGLGVDTLFVGQHFAVLNERESRMSFCRSASLVKRSFVKLTYADRVLLLKPHGSLDWFLHDGQPVRCPLHLCQNRLVITPGLNKFRTGYDRPFDTHREKANECIDRATRFLILGYGFNDDHLQTHLAPRLKSGAPALVLTKTLSEKARGMVASCDGMMALAAPDDTHLPGAQFVDKSSTANLPGADLWDLNVFIQEVLEP